MRSIELTPEQQARLRRELARNPSSVVYRRAAAILAVHQGRSVHHVAQLLGVTRQSVYNWLDAYTGPAAQEDLRDAPRPGRPPAWSPDLHGLLQTAMERGPTALGCPADSWTPPILRDFITAKAGRSFSGETLRRKLDLLGYVWRDGRYAPRNAARAEPRARSSSTPPSA
jgi:transposase